jgi:DNA polymerase-3 subunit gamma/tau
MLNIIAENEKIEIEDDALLLIARQANGGMRDAISIFEQMSSGKKITYEKVRQCLGLVGHQFHENFYRLLQDSALQKSFTALQELNREGYDLLQFCQEFLFYLREKMLENLDNYEIIQEIVFITTTFSRAKDEIKSAIIPQLPLEVAIIEVCHRKNIIPQNNQSPKKGFLESWGFGSSKTEKIMDQDQSATIKTKNTESLTQPKAEVSIDDHLIREENFDKTNAIPEVEEALSLEDVKSNWNRVFDKINTPFIKISLKDCLPTAIENKTIILTFKSKFHLGKIAEIKNKLEVMNAIEETIKYKIDLECRLGKIEEVVPPPSAEKQENIKEMIQEIFG